MQYVQKTLATLALAGLCGSAWAKAVTFEEIERADTVSGRYISHLSATEMDTVEGSAAPLIVAGVAAVGGAIANGTNYWISTGNPNVRDLAWHAGTGFTAGTLGAIAATMPPVGAVITTGAAAFVPVIPPPTHSMKCGAAGLAC